jgi:hypothetical protein
MRGCDIHSLCHPRPSRRGALGECGRQLATWIHDKAQPQGDEELRELSDRIFDATHSATSADETSGTKLDTSRSEMGTILEILIEHDDETHVEFVRLREALEDFLSR